MDSITNPKGENNKRVRSWGTFPSLQHFGVKGHVEIPGWELKRVTSNSITHTNLHKPNNKLVNA